MDGLSDRLGQSTRCGAVGVVIFGVHVVLVAIIARATLLPPQVPDAPALSVDIVLPEQPQRLETPLPTPKLTSVQPQMIVPDIALQLPPSPDAITPVAAMPGPPAPKATGPVGPATPLLVSDVAYLRQPEPHYPPESRHHREEGLVVLRVLIDREGRAQQVTVVHSSGHPRLDAAACDAVTHALFKPHLLDGVPREALATVPVEFSLHRV